MISVLLLIGSLAHASNQFNGCRDLILAIDHDGVEVLGCQPGGSRSQIPTMLRLDVQLAEESD